MPANVSKIRGSKKRKETRAKSRRRYRAGPGEVTLIDNPYALQVKKGVMVVQIDWVDLDQGKVYLDIMRRGSTESVKPLYDKLRTHTMTDTRKHDILQKIIASNFSQFIYYV